MAGLLDGDPSDHLAELRALAASLGLNDSPPAPSCQLGQIDQLDSSPSEQINASAHPLLVHLSSAGSCGSVNATSPNGKLTWGTAGCHGSPLSAAKRCDTPGSSKAAAKALLLLQERVTSLEEHCQSLEEHCKSVEAQLEIARRERDETATISHSIRETSENKLAEARAGGDTDDSEYFEDEPTHSQQRE